MEGEPGVARYPSSVGEWALRPYGAYGDAWDEAKQQCRATLLAFARDGKPRTYSELVRHVTAIPWPDGPYTHHGRQIGTLLGQASLEELDRTDDRPVLSAIVVGQEEGMPSAGFWTLLEDELGIPVPRSDLDRLTWWAREFEAACAFYGKMAAS
jgi:hypothetical protein